MLYTVHVHKPGDILYIVQYITWVMYSISPALHTCTVYHLVYVPNYLCSCTVHDITKTFGTWKLVYTYFTIHYIHV